MLSKNNHWCTVFVTPLSTICDILFFFTCACCICVISPLKSIIWWIHLAQVGVEVPTQQTHTLLLMYCLATQFWCIIIKLFIAQAVVPCAHYSASCKQITSHHSVNKWAQMTWQYVAILMGTPPADSLRDVYLKTPCWSGYFPFSHRPSPWTRKKTEEIFHTLRVIFLTDCDCVGRDPAAIFSHGSSTAEARWSSARRAQTTNPTANAAHYCLTSFSRCKTQWALTASRWRSTRVDRCFLSTDVFPQVLLVIFLLSAPDDVALLSF